MQSSKFFVQVSSYAGPDEPSVNVVSQFGRQGGDVLKKINNRRVMFRPSAPVNCVSSRSVRRSWCAACCTGSRSGGLG